MAKKIAKNLTDLAAAKGYRLIIAMPDTFSVLHLLAQLTSPGR